MVKTPLLTRLRDEQLTLNPEITLPPCSMQYGGRRPADAEGDPDRPVTTGDADLRGGLRKLSPRLQNSAAVERRSRTVPACCGLIPTPSYPARRCLASLRQFVTGFFFRSTLKPCHRHGSTAINEPRKKKDDAPRKPPRGKIRWPAGRAGGGAGFDIARALEEQEHGGSRRRLGEILVALGFKPKWKTVLAAQQTLERNRAKPRLTPFASGVNLLDKLMTLVGRIRSVLARNQLMQLTSTLEDTGLQAVSERRMNLIATELQEQVMKTRTSPYRKASGGSFRAPGAT